MKEQFVQELAAASNEQIIWSRFYTLLVDSYPESKVSLFSCTQIDPDRPYYICQSGLSKKVYTHRLGIHGKLYSDLFEFRIHPVITPLFRKYGFSGSLQMIIDDEKEACIMIQPTPGSQLSTIAFAEILDQTIQSIYEQHLPRGTGRYRNTTALSEPVTGVAAIRDGYLQTERLKAVSFFRMTPGVMTAERLASLKNHATYRDVMTLSRSLCQACTQGEDTKMLALAEKLFLDLLKHSYDMELVRDALSYIKQFLSIRLSVHLPKDETDLTALCSASSYIIIEECYEAILPVLTRLCHAVQHSGAWSDAVAYAAYFLRSNLSRDVSLPEIAAFADATPAYLSNLFHQQTGMTIKQYQQKIRMEHACHLLHTTQDKVTDIAVKTGFIDRRYFTRIFKETYGMTPQEYRQQS